VGKKASLKGEGTRGSYPETLARYRWGKRSLNWEEGKDEEDDLYGHFKKVTNSPPLVKVFYYERGALQFVIQGA